MFTWKTVGILWGSLLFVAVFGGIGYWYGYGGRSAHADDANGPSLPEAQAQVMVQPQFVPLDQVASNLADAEPGEIMFVKGECPEGWPVKRGADGEPLHAVYSGLMNADGQQVSAWCVLRPCEKAAER